MGLNAALLACPITWIVIGFVALVAALYAVVGAINQVTGSSISATGLITGAVATALAFVGNLFITLVNAGGGRVCGHLQHNRNGGKLCGKRVRRSSGRRGAAVL